MTNRRKGFQAGPGQQSHGPQGAPSRQERHVVALGGGTGLPVVLRGLRVSLFPPGMSCEAGRDQGRLVGIVTVTDDGGSSGRLRKAYRVLPPGDIRNCLLALAEGDSTMAAIFDFRFNGNGDVGGHSLGNLILTALSQLEQDFPGAVAKGAELLRVRGRVLPATPEAVELWAESEDGVEVAGESNVASARRAIRRVRLQPGDARALPEAIDAIGSADLIVIGPGSLYTSLIPVLLVRDLADAVARSRARVVLIMNLMTEPGETDGYSAVEHVLAIGRHAPQVRVHDILVNSAPIPPSSLEMYEGDGARPVASRVEVLRALGYRTIERDLLAPGSKVRHDSQKLATALLNLADEVSG